MTLSLKSEVYLKYCRTCARKNAEVSIFASEELTGSLSRKIERHLPIKVSENDDLPIQLCHECANTLTAWDTFVDGALRAEVHLQELLDREVLKNEILEDSPAFSSDGGNESDNLPLVKLASTAKKKKGRVKKNTAANANETKARSKNSYATNSQSVRLPSYDSKLEKRQICPMCLKSVRSMENHLSQHNLRSGVSIRFCLICGHESEGFEQLSHHLHSHIDYDDETDDVTSPSQCRKCLRDFEDYEKLINHLIMHISGIGRGNPRKTVHCAACGKSILRSTLLRHLATHTGEKRFTCHRCGNRYSQESGLLRHVRNAHDGVRRYKCPICGAVFQSNSELRSHQDTHPDPRPFQCDECGRTFQSQKHLYHHHKYHHTENGLRVECPQCDRWFSSASVLRRHHKVVHLRLKEFQCKICSAQLSTKQYLQEHLRTHTDERPEVCTICGKTFQMAGNLRQHMKTHMERSQVCDVCGKRFARRCQLVIHMGSHRGLTQPQCGQCGKVFLLKTDLNKHLTSSHASQGVFRNEVSYFSSQE